MFESFILAGGKSSRMRRNKAFLKLGDRTILEHSISTLQKIKSKKISVVVAQQLEEIDIFPKEISIISDIYKNKGTLGGIHSALSNCKERFVVILACDLPFTSSELLDFLLNSIKNTEFACVAPIQQDGIIQPLCAIYNVEKCLETIAQILEKDEKLSSTKSILDLLKAKFIDFDKFADLPNSEHFFFNVNTPKDFEQAIRIFDEK